MKKLDYFLITAPENIAWILNIRGYDTSYSPIPNARLLISKNGRLTLFETYPSNPGDCVGAFSAWNNLIGDPALHLWTDTPKDFSTVPLIINNVSQYSRSPNFLNDSGNKTHSYKSVSSSKVRNCIGSDL